MAFGRDGALTFASALVGAVEHRQMLVFQVGSTLNGHGAANVIVGIFHLAAGETQMLQHIEIPVAQLFVGNAEHILAEILAEGPLVESELDLESTRQGRLNGFDLVFCKTERFQLYMTDGGTAFERAMPFCVFDDFVGLLFIIAQLTEGVGHALIHNFKVPAAGQLFEFDQSKVGLDSGGIAVHHQSDSAGGCDHGDLRVAVTVLFAQFKCAVGILAGGLEQVIGTDARVDTQGQDGKALVLFGGFIPGGTAVVADHAEHVLPVVLISGESSQLFRHLGAGGVAGHVHDGGNGAAQCHALLAVVGYALNHQQGADIGIAEAKSAEFIGEFGDLLRRKLCHQNGNLQYDCPEACGVAESLHIKHSGLEIVELDEVQ